MAKHSRGGILFLTILFSILLFLSVASSVGGLVLWILRTKYLALAISMLFGGLAVALISILVIAFTRDIYAGEFGSSHVNKYPNRPTSPHAAGTDPQGNVQYCTYEGIELTKTEYGALTILMEKCRNGEITKKEYLRARARFTTTRE